ncbi:hypothetical protein AYI69_g7985 [Smittium culicis]|uniref:Uncharacterized protein n=1 Tax=Smittium culicis TaxID=133412 RepID=A0A1R1XN53_9FUNG|nr:hypothetical protein AYI69_g7985 [Smittium culicis]
MFQQLRLSMISAPFPVHPEKCQPHALSTDSCYVGVGGSLHQKHSQKLTIVPATKKRWPLFIESTSSKT